MYTVIYSLDFEPITVVDLPKEFLDTLEKKGVGYLRVKETESICKLICGSILWPDGTLKPVVVTSDEETALLMQCSWLPGQTGYALYLKRQIRTLTDKLIKAMRK